MAFGNDVVGGEPHAEAVVELDRVGLGSFQGALGDQGGAVVEDFFGMFSAKAFRAFEYDVAGGAVGVECGEHLGVDLVFGSDIVEQDVVAVLFKDVGDAAKYHGVELAAKVRCQYGDGPGHLANQGAGDHAEVVVLSADAFHDLVAGALAYVALAVEDGGDC